MRRLKLAPGSITDVSGLLAGHAQAPGRETGCTVVLCPPGTVGGVAQRGGAPGTRETDLLRPENTVNVVHAVLLTGGSAFGLDAAGGVMRWLEAQGIGLPVGSAGVRVPIVPAAVLFDLWQGDARIRPDASTGHAACEAARASAPHQGRVGAGAGATCGKLYGIERAMPGGIGTASLRLGDITVAALVAVNALGDVIDAQGRVLAGARTSDGAGLQDTSGSLFADAAANPDGHGGAGPARWRSALSAGTATTLGVVATDALLDKSAVTQLAQLAQHGLSRAVSPLTAHDGDTLFGLATGGAGHGGDISALGALAAEVVARAIRNAVIATNGL